MSVNSDVCVRIDAFSAMWMVYALGSWCGDYQLRLVDSVVMVDVP